MGKVLRVNFEEVKHMHHSHEPQDEINELKKNWKGSEGELQIAIQQLNAPITADVIEAAFVRAIQGSGLTSVAVLQRFSRFFRKPHRWEDSGIIAIATHFMCDDDDYPFLPGYAELLERRTQMNPELLDAVYQATPELSALRGYIGSMRLRRYRGLDYGRAVGLLRMLTEHPGLQLKNLSDHAKWPENIKVQLRRLDSLCSCCA